VFGNSTGVSAILNPVVAGAVHYQIAIPQQTPLRLMAKHRCSVQDSNGNPAASGPGLMIPPVQGESATVSLTAK
jgi:hypothetical protein